MAQRWIDFAKEIRVLPRFTGDEPSLEYLRECLAAQKCPWCGRAGFQTVANHVSRMHGIDRFKLRDLAGYVKGVTLTDADYHERRVDISKRAYREHNLGRHLKSRGGRSYSLAGMAVQRAKMAAMKADAAIQERQRVASLEANAMLRKGHACPECGTWITHARPVRCSRACREVFWSRAGKHAGAIRATKPPRYACVVCDTALRQKRPVTCSRPCFRALASRLRRQRAA